MRLDRTGNAKRNIIVCGADKTLGVLLPFIVRTMIIHIIGSEYLGLTSLYYSILQMLNLSEMGFGQAIIYSLYKPIAENNTDEINALVKFYRKVYRYVGAFVMGAGLVIMPFLPFFIKGETPSGVNIYFLYLIYLVNAVIGLVVYPERKALFFAHQRDDVSSRIHIISQLIMYVGQAVFIVLTKDYYLYAVMMPVTSIIYSVYCGAECKKMYPEYVGKGTLDKDKAENIKKQVIGLTIRKLASFSRNTFDSIFVSAYFGLTINSYYANYYYIMDSVVIILAVLKSSLAGGVGNSIALETKEKNLNDMQKINFLYMWISGWLATCMLCLYQPFMRIWVHEENMLPFTIALLFAISFYIYKTADIRTLYGESVGIWWEMRYLSVVEAIMNIALNWTFIHFWGLHGIILASIVTFTICNFAGGAIILYRVYFNGKGCANYFLSHLKYGLATVVVAAGTYWLVSLLPEVGVVSFVFKCGICAIIPNIIMFLLLFYTKDFKESMKLARKLLRAKN